MDLLIGFFVIGMVLVVGAFVFQFVMSLGMLILIGVFNALGYIWEKIRGNDE